MSTAATLTGTGTLLRFLLRRDRIRLPGWTLGLALLMAYFSSAVRTVFAAPEDLESFRGYLDSPAGALFGGPSFGESELTVERFIAGEYLLTLLVAAGLMGLLTVTRHTRAEERAGRAELVRAGVVGRSAQLTAALALTAAMSLAVAALIAAVLLRSGFDAAGSVLFGASVGAVGLVFAGVGAVAVQLSAYPRAGSATAGAVLGAAFVLRALGDAASTQGGGLSRLSWASPLGWSQQTAPYVHDRWWPLGLSLAFTAASVALAYRLAGRRDLDAGLIPPRPGRAHAPGWLRDPLTLAFRLQRASLLGWTLALLVAGAAYGAFTRPLVEGFADAPADVLALLGGAANLLRGYLGLMGLTMALLVSVFAVLAVQAVRAEETSGRAEPVLATAVGRTAWLGGHLAVAALAVPWLLLVAGLATGAGAALSADDPGLVLDTALGHLAHTPAVWFVLAVSALLYGAVPGALPAAWALPAYGLVTGYFGDLLGLPEAAAALSPFAHTCQYPLEPVNPPALAVLLALAAALTLAALRAFRARDLRTTA
ncbi:ABC transporter permease [Actinocorallia sp. API 0066]|uniref:ABC transporter permease n=1 Tax=Actinocorallia sp. API 0066 TaxID=2896846 RepID=UPI001E3A1D3B|nr:ABC transporter permease [Actinocorallia sp. API 0066]MCD0448521.1 ABC transporter permease [Actinocorallia sp. API 0066]